MLTAVTITASATKTATAAGIVYVFCCQLRPPRFHVDWKQCRAKLIFAFGLQLGTLRATLRSTGVQLLKNITFLYVFGGIRWSDRLGGDGLGLGLTGCVIAVVPEFPAPCGCSP